MVEDHVEPEVERKVDENRAHHPGDEVIPGEEVEVHVALLQAWPSNSAENRILGISASRSVDLDDELAVWAAYFGESRTWGSGLRNQSTSGIAQQMAASS
jgi:hypothetical protein